MLVPIPSTYTIFHDFWQIWKDYDADAQDVVEDSSEDASGPLKREYLDVIISDVRTTNGFGFSVQILNTEGKILSLILIGTFYDVDLLGIAALEKLMRDFSLHHRSAPPVPSNFVPEGGQLVSAKFSDGSWYRAKIRRASPIKKEAEVTFIDYGNQDTVSFSNIRPLDPKFRSLAGQAHEARLR